MKPTYVVCAVLGLLWFGTALGIVVRFILGPHMPALW